MRSGALPPVARRMVQPDGTKLEWDLDQNGRIDPDECGNTERELYDAV